MPLRTFRIALHPSHRALFTDTVLKMAQRHDASFTVEDIKSMRKNEIWGRDHQVCTFKCFPQDEDRLYDFRDRLENMGIGSLISRQEAIEKKLSRYFTGQPCKRGHISERYTKTLGCIECLHPTFESEDVRQRKARLAATKEAGRRKQQQILASRKIMKHIRVRLHEADVELFESVLLASTFARNSLIELKHIRSRVAPKSIGPSRHIHTFLCFPEDEGSLRELQNNLERAR